MANHTDLTSLIQTKLHQPPIHEKIIHRQRLFDLLDQPIQRPLTLVVAPAGYGKTMLVSHWLDVGNSPSAWVSLDENDNDLHLFLNYFLAAVQTISPDAVPESQAMANALTLPLMRVLAGSLINELNRMEKPFIMVLDDFHLIKDEFVLDLISQLLRHPSKSIRLVIISRRDPPLPISTMRAQNLMLEIRTQHLRFNEMEIATFLTQELGTQIDSSTTASMEKKTEGWVTGLCLAALSMRHRGNIDLERIEPETNAQYVMEYLFTEVFSHQPQEIRQYLLSTAILDRFCGPLCAALYVRNPETVTSEIKGWDFIAWLNQENMFLIPLDAEKYWFRFHHSFRKLLLNQLKRQLIPEDINALYTRASDWFAENGLIEEAIKIALAGGDPATAAKLVARHGFNLVSEEQWLTLERWLKLLPNDILNQDPALVILKAWTHLVQSREAELVSCLDRAEALLSARPNLPAPPKYVQGHLDVMRARQHYISGEAERVLFLAERANENIPLEHRYPRIIVFAQRALGKQMAGNTKKAYSVVGEMLRDETLRTGVSEGRLLATLFIVYWIEADLVAVLQTATRLLEYDANLQNQRTLGYGRYFSSIAYYQRNELHAARENLLPLVKSPSLLHAWNFTHSAAALALIYQAWGRADKANEIAESMISFALDTNNSDALIMTRAFSTELALRQGRLAEASKWAEHFAAKPFGTMYRFYVPQFTLVRVLIAQDTADSREKAGDLLMQIYDFVVSTHNIRFQIDVLALQSLLHDSQNDEPAALKALTEALALAKPGGFIRPFADSGPQMADLLKLLIKQNVSVEYIGRILAAYGEDGKRAIQDESDHPPAQLPHISTQPLVDPLSNRELDVIELLKQRLTSKEIADKLFISTATVKKHLSNIYGKLNVAGRRQAVEKAKALGIINSG